MLIPSIIFSHCKDHEKSMILPLMGNQCKYLVMFLRSFYIYTYIHMYPIYHFSKHREL